MLHTRVEEQLGPFVRLDEGARGLEVLEEERVGVLAVHLHRNVRRPGLPELGDWEAGVHEQGAAGAGTGLRELLGDHHPEGEAGVYDVGADSLGGGYAALGEGAKACFAGEGQPLLDRVERAAVEQVGCVDGVPALPQLVGERLHPVGQSLHMVVEQNLGHGIPPDD
jgi:hypothetical protein